MDALTSDTFLFEGFRLDRCGAGLFRCDDGGTFARVAVGSRALDILGVLIERAGEVVSKEEILVAVWPETVVEDSNLTVQISALRRVLDRGRSHGSYIPSRHRVIWRACSCPCACSAERLAAADIARAKGLVEQALAASPRSPLAHYAKAQVLRARNRYENATPEHETPLAFNRNWAEALSGFAICKSYAGYLNDVIPLFEQSIRLSPRDPLIGVSYFHVGRLHLLQSRVDEAMIWLEKARSAMPEHMLAHAYRASVYGIKGESERGAAELAEARTLALDDRYSSLARLRANGISAGYWGVPSVRALFEATYFVGLRKAGMLEE